MELEGITAAGVPTGRACRIWLAYRSGKHSPFITFPGLDADKCICDYCRTLNPSGVWWFDQRLRSRSSRDWKSSIDNGS